MIFRIFYLYFYLFLYIILCSSNNNNNSSSSNLVRIISDPGNIIKNTKSYLLNKNTQIENGYNDNLKNNALLTSKNDPTNRQYRSLKKFLEILERDTENLIQTISEMNKLINVQEQQEEFRQQSQALQKMEQHQQIKKQNQKEFFKFQNKNNHEISKNDDEMLNNAAAQGINVHNAIYIQGSDKESDLFELPPLIESNSYAVKDVRKGINLCEQNEKLKSWENQIAVCKEILRSAKSIIPSSSALIDSPSTSSPLMSLTPTSSSLSPAEFTTSLNVDISTSNPKSPPKRKTFRILTKHRDRNYHDWSTGDNIPIWSEWSKWTPCSVSCGNGKQLRFRKCSGEACNADYEMDQRKCNLQSCDQEHFTNR